MPFVWGCLPPSSCRRSWLHGSHQIVPFPGGFWLGLADGSPGREREVRRVRLDICSHGDQLRLICGLLYPTHNFDDIVSIKHSPDCPVWVVFCFLLLSWLIDFFLYRSRRYLWRKKWKVGHMSVEDLELIFLKIVHIFECLKSHCVAWGLRATVPWLYHGKDTMRTK
jgi:hypothetical protein